MCEAGLKTRVTTEGAIVAGGRRLGGVLEVVVESAGLFVLGFALMQFFYSGSIDGPGEEIGAPGHDSFYHTKMAEMLPEVGLPGEFPWLEYVYFTREGKQFVSHHVGFHLLLMPFVKTAQGAGYDALTGARWAICTFFGMNLVLFNLLLRAGRVPFRYAWLVLFLLMPHQFFVRHAFVRAIGASFVFMQLLLLALVRRWYVAGGLIIAAYIHLYLGAVMYTPMIVGLFVLAAAIGPRDAREWPWRMVGFCAAGWMFGVCTYPYFSGMIEFLRLQVLGSGLSPDISVGREWKPYTDPWWFVQMASVTLGVWVASVCLRLRFGPRLDSRELGLTLLNLAFLVLTLKARRFVEYWPAVCLLSSAYLMVPVLGSVRDGWRRWLVDESGVVRVGRLWVMSVGVVLVGVLVCVSVALGAGMAEVMGDGLRAAMREYRVWMAVVPLVALWPLTRIWMGESEGVDRVAWRLAGVLMSGAVLALGIFGFAWAVAMGGLDGAGLSAARIGMPVWGWMVVVCACVLVPLVSLSVGGVVWLRGAGFGGRTGLALGWIGLVFVFFAGTATLGGAQFAAIGSQLRCNYDLGAMRDMMAFLERQSEPGDIVFTDDWDIFPVYFYHNTHNHYIVGLDPKFTHERRPVLWERYVKISRGQVPATATVRVVGENGRVKEERIRVRLEDIREVFGAQFVIVDRDHRALAMKLNEAPALAELVYPCERYALCDDAPYLIYRVRDADEAATERREPRADERGRLFLSALWPVSVDQGWGELGFDRTVEGRPLRMRGRLYSRGLGTHAPSSLLFEIPAGYEAFVATVGVDDETDGAGSVIASVSLDGREVFRSPVLTGASPPAEVRIPLGGARQLLLRAEVAGDGQRFDHVAWGEARFEVGAGGD